MAKYDLNVSGGGTKKPRGKRLPGGSPSLPPSTLPQPSVPTLPEKPEPTKSPAVLDPQPGGGGSAEPTPPKKPAAGGGAPYVPADEGYSPAPEEDWDTEFHMPGEDEEARKRYEEALRALEELQKTQPQYDNRYDDQIQALYAQIAGRGPFRYDSATDPLYQQYRQSYARQGQMAMRDTMGQAAALTGGYGSSYSQSVGQQQYDAYLSRLADVLPETYGMALNAWTAEGKELQQRYDAAVSLEQSDYARYLDELGQYNRELDRARGDAQEAYERKRAIEEEAYRRAVDDYNRRIAAEKLAYQREKAAETAARSVSRSGGGKKKKTKAGSGNILGDFNKRKGH